MWAVSCLVTASLTWKFPGGIGECPYALEEQQHHDQLGNATAGLIDAQRRTYLARAVIEIRSGSPSQRSEDLLGWLVLSVVPR